MLTSLSYSTFIFAGQYRFPEAVTQGETTLGPHPQAKVSATARLSAVYGSSLSDLYPGPTKAATSTNAAFRFVGTEPQSGNLVFNPRVLPLAQVPDCTCTPVPLQMCDLTLGCFVQVTMRPVDSDASRPVFTCFRVSSHDDVSATITACGTTGLITGSIGLSLRLGANGSMFLEDTQVYLYKYGFVSDAEYRTATWVETNDFGLVMKNKRRIFGLTCMFGCCTTHFDGVEYGMFRLSKETMLSNAIFALFDEQKLSMGYEFWIFYY